MKSTVTCSWRSAKEPAALAAAPPAKPVRALAPAAWLFVFGVLAMVFTLVFVGAQFAAGGHGPHDAFLDGGHGADHALTVNATNDDTWAPAWQT